LNNERIILQDKFSKKITLKRVLDTIYDRNRNIESSQFFWIYEESSEFFPFQVWDKLAEAKIGQMIETQDNTYKVIRIYEEDKILYS
jgi:hypothetical protein